MVILDSKREYDYLLLTLESAYNIGLLYHWLLEYEHFIEVEITLQNWGETIYAIVEVTI